MQKRLVLTEEVDALVQQILKRKPSGLVQITVQEPYGFHRYWWATPDLKHNDDSRGAAILTWTVEVEQWPNAGKVVDDID